jgi:hypothetical protein
VVDWDHGDAFYQLYRYDPASGFVQMGRIKVPSDPNQWATLVRGLTIDGRLYVATSRSVMVYQLDGFVQVAKVALDK